VPKEIAYFIPPDPEKWPSTTRRDGFPAGWVPQRTSSSTEEATYRRHAARRAYVLRRPSRSREPRVRLGRRRAASAPWSNSGGGGRRWKTNRYDRRQDRRADQGRYSVGRSALDESQSRRSSPLRHPCPRVSLSEQAEAVAAAERIGGKGGHEGDRDRDSPQD